MPFDLSDQDWAAVCEGVARGEYNLLLGAGASIGATGGDGAALPTAATLADEIVHTFGIDTGGDQVDLKAAYELAGDLTGSSGQTIAEYFRTRFTRCTPTWQRALTQFRWHRIWTLNIDDVVEQAFQSTATMSRQHPTIYTWTERFSDRSPNTRDVQIVHLHGYAARPDQQFIFSILEYLQATSPRYSWHRIFGDHFYESPFIVVGARLTDEYDLADFLRRTSKSRSLTGRPSVLVLRKIAAYQAAQFNRWGLLPAESSTSDFFTALSSAVAPAEARLAALVPGLGASGTELPAEAISFLSQFNSLRTHTKSLEPPKHDFYQGDEPLWLDILADRDAPFEVVDKIVDQCSSAYETDPLSQHIYCIWNGAGSGKTAALLRIGQRLLAHGFEPFLFRAEERIDRSAALWWLSHAPRSVFLIDGLADTADEIGRLARDCARENVGLFVVGVERDRRSNQVYETIPTDVLASENEYSLDQLSDEDINRLVRKLQEARRLGKLTPESYEMRLRYFRKTAGRQLLAAMAELERGKSFVDRIRDVYSDDVGSDDLRNVYAVTCMASIFGYPLPIAIAANATGLGVDEILSAVDEGGGLAGIVSVESRGLRPRHRLIANILVDRVLDRDTRFLTSQSLARSLSPYISPNTMRQRTIPYRIIRQLMSHDVLRDWIRLDRARRWYEGLSSEYDWNSRYWEQRALVEVELGAFAKARSFAEAAVNIERHPNALNTLASILMKMAMEFPNRPDENMFWEGLSHLTEARGRERGATEYPFSTFFSHALTFARHAYRGQRVPQKLANAWQEWMRTAEETTAFSRAKKREELREFQRAWLLLAAGQ